MSSSSAGPFRHGKLHTSAKIYPTIRLSMVHNVTYLSEKKKEEEEEEQEEMQEGFKKKQKLL